jgi:hypothetical protein
VKRYDFEISTGQFVGVHEAYVHISTATKQWEVTVPTDQGEFSVLTPEIKKNILNLGKTHGGIDTLLEAIDEEIVTEVDRIHVRMVEEGCKVNRNYLYVSSYDIFQSESDLIKMAKEHGEIDWEPI